VCLHSTAYLAPAPECVPDTLYVVPRASARTGPGSGVPAEITPAGAQSPRLAVAAAGPAATVASGPAVDNPAAAAADLGAVPPSVTENTLNQINNSTFAQHFLYVHRLGDGSWWCG